MADDTMNVLDQCEVQTVEIRTVAGLMKIEGHRWQDFAVVKNAHLGWQIAHLPSGMFFGGDKPDTVWMFPTAEGAAEAMIEISRLRNRWVDLPEETVDDDGLKIDAIHLKHGAVLKKGHDAGDDLKRGSSLNGYEEPTIERKEA